MSEQAMTAHDERTAVVPVEPDSDQGAAWESLRADYLAGYDAGYGDRMAGQEPRMTEGAPTNEPWRTSYCRGYLDAWIDAGYDIPPALTGERAGGT